MNTEQSAHEDGRVVTGVRKRRLTRYSKQERKALLQAFDQSVEGQKEFCAARGVNLGTFKGWLQKQAKQSASMGFAKVELPVSSPAPVEITFTSGIRMGIRHQGDCDELIALIRGVAGC